MQPASGRSPTSKPGREPGIIARARGRFRLRSTGGPSLRPKRAAHSELRVDRGQCKFSTPVETLDSGGLVRQRGREPHSQFQQTFVGLLRNLSSCAVKIGPALLQGQPGCSLAAVDGCIASGASAGNLTISSGSNCQSLRGEPQRPALAAPLCVSPFEFLCCGLCSAAVSENMLSVETA